MAGLRGPVKAGRPKRTRTFYLYPLSDYIFTPDGSLRPGSQIFKYSPRRCIQGISSHMIASVARPCSNGRKVQALNLPREVLEKFYHANAQRLLRLPAP